MFPSFSVSHWKNSPKDELVALAFLLSRAESSAATKFLHSKLLCASSIYLSSRHRNSMELISMLPSLQQALSTWIPSDTVIQLLVSISGLPMKLTCPLFNRPNNWNISNESCCLWGVTKYFWTIYFVKDILKIFYGWWLFHAVLFTVSSFHAIRYSEYNDSNIVERICPGYLNPKFARHFLSWFSLFEMFSDAYFPFILRGKCRNNALKKICKYSVYVLKHPLASLLAQQTIKKCNISRDWKFL